MMNSPLVSSIKLILLVECGLGFLTLSQCVLSGFIQIVQYNCTEISLVVVAENVDPLVCV